MNRFLPRPNFVVWTLAFGAVLSQLDAPPLIIHVPWFVVWTVLVLLVGLGVPSVVRRSSFAARPTERFPEVYEQDISYTPAAVGKTIRLIGRER
jgi:hypothetical protein